MDPLAAPWEVPPVGTAIRELRTPLACMTAGARHGATRPWKGRHATVIRGAEYLASSIRRVRLTSIEGAASRVGSQCGEILQHPVARGADAGVRTSPEGRVATAFAGRHTDFSDSGSGRAESAPWASHRQKQCGASIRTALRQGRKVTGRRRRETSFSRQSATRQAFCRSWSAWRVSRAERGWRAKRPRRARRRSSPRRDTVAGGRRPDDRGAKTLAPLRSAAQAAA